MNTQQIHGADELLAKLKALDGDAMPKVVVKANRAGAAILLGAARAESPELSGLMKRKIKIRTSNRKAKGVYTAKVGVGAKDWTGEAFYAAFVMWGHKVGKRTKEVLRVARLRKRFGSAVTPAADSRASVPANDFLKRTAEQSGEAAAAAVIDGLKTGIEAAAAAGSK